MCAPKSKGGKRCLYHAALSKFSIRSTQHKTGAPEKEIASTMSALNREGKNLPAPDKAEVDTYLASQKFATEYDPSLSEHERKIQLGQLDRATREAEEGVSGGNFHAWKNILPVMTARVKRRALAAALVPVTMFGMAGCAAQFGDASPAEGAPVSQDTINSMFVGDQKLSDEFGEYTSIKLQSDDYLSDRASSFFSGAPAHIKEGLARAGITSKEELTEAYTLVSNFTVEGIYDSKIVDHMPNDEEEVGWVNTLNEKYPMHESTLNGMLSSEGRASLFVGRYDPQTEKGVLPLLARDGRPRASKYELIPVYGDTIDAPDDGRAVAVFQINTASVHYRVTDEEAIKHLMDGKKITKEEALAFQKADSLVDGKMNKVALEGSVTIGLSRADDGGFRIDGIKSHLEMDVSDYLNK